MTCSAGLLREWEAGRGSLSISIHDMKQKKKPLRDVRKLLGVWPATKDRLRKRAFKEGKDIADLVDELSKLPLKRGVQIRGSVN